MPTLLSVGRYLFYFFSNEGKEPPHIHVKAAEDQAKFWLDPIALASNYGFRAHDLNENGMSISIETKPRSKTKFRRAYRPTAALARSVKFTEEMMEVYLTDGRIISVPIIWFPLLYEATPEQRERYEIGGGGTSLHWPEIDEDISIAGLLAGADWDAA